MPLINCKISLHLKWSRKYLFVTGTATNQVPVVTLSSQENVKLLKQLESGFKRTINWNKYQSETTNQAQNRYLDFPIDASFHRVNRLFALSFKDEDGQESYKQYHLTTVEIKYYNVMIDGRNFFDQSIKNDLET